MAEASLGPRDLGSDIVLRLRKIFRPDWYLKRFPDVAATDVAPDQHFFSVGIWENRDPNPLFDGAWYRREYSTPSDVPPILHYLAVGSGEGFAPSPLVDVAHYRRTAQFDAWAETDLEHYLTRGWLQSVDPHPLFSCAWYLVRSRMKFGASWSPFEDYVTRTGDDIIPGCPWFSERDYLLQRPDLAKLQIHPLYHWTESGQREGFPKNWLVETQPYGHESEDRAVVRTTDPYYQAATDPRLLSSGDPLRKKIVSHLAGRNESFKKNVTVKRDSGVISIDWGTWAKTLQIPCSDKPEVSVIIPTLDHVEDVVLTLDSIASSSESTPFEVILVDDGSQDECSRIFSLIDGIRLVTHQSNTGFAGACESGIKKASGKYIYLLNNDVEVVTGWLDSLASVLECDETVGAVGSMLIRPDNRLQESGVIVWSDATGWQIGNGQSPFNPLYRTRRIVDYCSGASLMIRREIWDAIGGFDPRFRPAYYEDTDLCFEIAKRGRTVVCEPASVLFHNEGSTHGRTNGGGKRHQFLNQPRFHDKWKSVLSLREAVPAKGPTGEMVARESNKSSDPIVLVVDHKELTPDMDSGSLRMHRIIEEFVAQGRRVIFHAIQGVPNSRWTSQAAALGVEVYDSQAPIADVLRGLGDHIEFAWISRPQVMIDFVPELLRWASHVTVVYDMVDAHGLRLEREAVTKQSVFTARKSRLERGQERAAARLADVVVTLSDRDEAYIRSIAETPITTVQIPNVHSADPTVIPFDERVGLLFVGGYEHEPNVDAVMFLINEIMPLVWQKIGDVPVTLAGSRPTREVERLASPLVSITGWVNDLRPLYESHRVAVAPLRYGAGVKGKVGEALSYGIATVTTRIGAEGMPCETNKDILVADNATVFASAIINAYTDRQLWTQLSQNGPAAIDAAYGRTALSGRVKDLFRAVRDATDHNFRSQIPYTT